jgi:uncharacterized protein YuzE
MSDILKHLNDDELDTLVQFKANGFKLNQEDKTDHLSDAALGYMSELKLQNTKPKEETTVPEPNSNYNDLGNVHPAPIVTGQNDKPKKDISNYNLVENTINEAKDIILTPYRKFKDWWNKDETINHNSKIDNDTRFKVSQLSNPKDPTFTSMIGDLTGVKSISELGKREYSEDDVKNYQTSVLNAIGDKYEVEFDKSSGLPSARLKGSKDKFEPILNDLGDASFEEIEERIKANTTQLASEVGLDLVGGYQGIKWASKFTKNPALLVIAGGAGSTVGSGLGAGVGTTVQSLASGEEITTKRLGAKALEEAQDAIVANTLALGAIGVVDLAVAGGKKVTPFHSVKKGKDEYLEKDLYDVQQTNIFSSTKTIEKREDQLKDIAKQKAQAEDVFLDFGGNIDHTEVLELAGQTNTKEILGNHYNHSQERINAEIANSVQLTKNFKNKFGLDDRTSADLYRLARGGTKRIKRYYTNLYKNSKDLIEEEIGENLVKVSSETANRLDELLDIAKHPTNVSNTFIEEPVKNKFNKDYQNLLKLTNSYFDEADGFTIKKLFEVQKTFNAFTNTHKDKFTYEQLKDLDSVKDAIYKDITRGINANVKDERLQKELRDLWVNANKEYKGYKKLLEREDILGKLLDRDNKFDVVKFSEQVFKDINKVSHDDINVLGTFAKQIKKTQGLEALDTFYSSVLDGLLKSKSVDVKSGEVADGIMQTISYKNGSVEVMNFDAFHKIYNSIDKKQLSKIFGGSSRGKRILYHLENFDKLAQKEAILQQNLIGKEFKYAQSAMQEHEVGKVAYSTAFGLKFGAWRWLSKNVLRSKAYEDFLLRAITKPRYEDIDNAISKLAYDQKELNPMQKIDIESLRDELRAIKEADLQTKEYIKQNPTASKEEIEQVSIDGLLEYKPFKDTSIRDYDTERVQAKELAKAEGMSDDAVDRIENFDQLTRELKSFKESKIELDNATAFNVKKHNTRIDEFNPSFEEIKAVEALTSGDRFGTFSHTIRDIQSGTYTEHDIKKYLDAKNSIDEEVLNSKINEIKTTKPKDDIELDEQGEIKNWDPSIPVFSKFADNLAVGTAVGVEIDEEGNITGFDPALFVAGFGTYTAAKSAAKYMIDKYKPLEAIAKKIDEFIESAEEDMAKLAGGGKPPVEYKDGDGFYSVLEKVVDDKVGGKIDSVSLTKMLKNNGVKDDEIEWSGLKELMESKDKLTKKEIEETIKENRLVIQKIEKTESKWHSEVDKDKYLLPNPKEYRELLFRMPKSTEQYKSKHFNESNILVFTRLTDRSIDNKKTLFIEELQSDWMQDKRKGKKVPDAPFKKNWAELGLKCMITEAIDGKYDKIAWTTAKQQIDRYKLNEKVDLLVYNKNSGMIRGDYKGSNTIFKEVASDEEVANLVGKDLANRLIDPKNSTRDDIYVLQGDDIEFGGEGMKTFYDQIIPNTVKKLFKKYRVKPKMEELDDLDEMVWSVDIPGQMKDDIKSHGQPLYMKGIEEIATGTLVGVELDEEGNITGIDVEKFLAGAIVGHIVSKQLKKEKRGIYNVTYNGKNSTQLRKYDLEALDDYIKYEKGNEKFGAVHIQKHLEDGSNGKISDEELLMMGEIIRDMDYFIQDGKRIYERFDDDIRYRVVVGDSKKGERVISFFSNKKEQK